MSGWRAGAREHLRAAWCPCCPSPQGPVGLSRLTAAAPGSLPSVCVLALPPLCCLLPELLPACYRSFLVSFSVSPESPSRSVEKHFPDTLHAMYTHAYRPKPFVNKRAYRLYSVHLQILRGSMEEHWSSWTVIYFKFWHPLAECSHVLCVGRVRVFLL